MPWSSNKIDKNLREVQGISKKEEGKAMFIRPTDLNTNSSKQLIGNFFQQHKDMKDLFEGLLDNKANNSPTLFQLYQEESWGDGGVFEGFKIYRNYIFLKFFNMKFLSKRPALLALIVFIDNMGELYKRLDGEERLNLIKRVKECVTNPHHFLGLQLELDTFYHFCVREGFTLIKWEGEGKPDMTIEKEGNTFDVECKTIDPLAGHPIPLDEADRFMHLLIPEESFRQYSTHGNIIQIAFDKKLASKNNKSIKTDTYSPEQLLQKFKTDPLITTTLTMRGHNKEKLANQSHLFFVGDTGSYVKLLSSVKNNHFDRFSGAIDNALNKTFKNPKVISVRPFGMSSEEFEDDEFRSALHNLYISKQEEGLFITFPKPEFKPHYVDGKLCGMRRTTGVGASMTNEFQRKYKDSFPWLNA